LDQVPPRATRPPDDSTITLTLIMDITLAKYLARLIRAITG